MDNYRELSGQNNNNRFRPNLDRIWYQMPRPQWQQWNNYEQSRPQWRDRGYQQRPEGNVNIGMRCMGDPEKPGPSYWMKEANMNPPQREMFSKLNAGKNKPTNNRRALN